MCTCVVLLASDPLHTFPGIMAHQDTKFTTGDLSHQERAVAEIIMSVLVLVVIGDQVGLQAAPGLASTELLQGGSHAYHFMLSCLKATVVSPGF